VKVTVTKLTDESLVKRACESTMHGAESKVTLDQIYRCQHSPIRTQIFWVEMVDIPSFVSTHLVRHKIGVEHFVMSNRVDRGGTGSETRNTPVNHSMLINAEALINMARKRLCLKASDETREVFDLVCSEVLEVDPALCKYLVPECEYRGGRCFELKPCGKYPRSN
jgi:hypothetical protein